jgi:MFS family permease
MSQPPRQAGPVQAITLLLPSTMATMGIAVLLPVLPMLFEHFKDVPNADYWVPMILTTPALCLVLFSPVAGFLADLVGRRRLLMIAMALYAVLGTLPLILDSIPTILASRVGVGIVEAAVLTISTTLIGDFFKGHQRDRWLGFQTAVASLSATVLIVVGGFLGTFGWRGPFAVYGTTVILLFAVWKLTWEPVPDVRAGETIGNPSWAGFPWQRMAGICLVTFFASVMFFMVQVQLSLALAEKGVDDPQLGGMLQGLASIGVPLGTILFQYLSRFHVSVPLTVAFLLMGAGFVGMGMAPDHQFLVGAALLDNFGNGIVLPTLLIWATRDLAFEQRGRGTGIWQGVFQVGQFVMPLVGTLLSHQLGGLFPAMSAMGFASLGAAVLACLFWLGRKRAPSGGDRAALSL